MKHVCMMNTIDFAYAPGSLGAKEKPYLLLMA
jgi:hypothetical protein